MPVHVAGRSQSSVPLETTTVFFIEAPGTLGGPVNCMMLIPAIYRLMEARDFDDVMHLLGVATSELDDATFRGMVSDALVEAGWPRDDVDRWCSESVM